MEIKKLRKKALGLATVLSICLAVILALKITNTAHAVSFYDEENELRVHNFLRDELGFNEAAIAGIMGNIYAESKFDINALNPNDTGGTFSYGICQWNSRSRYWRMIEWSVGNGAETGIMEVNGVQYQTVDIYYQLCYMAWELRQAPYYRYQELLDTPNTVEGAAQAAYCWAKYYEGCSAASHEYRKNKAVDVYWPKYGKKTFTDVNETDWFYEYATYVADRGVMTGCTETEFAPSVKLTRAMAVMMLYKMEGYPGVDAELPVDYDDSGNPVITEEPIKFADVSEGKWYTDAIEWAARNHIVEGSINADGTRVFRPNEEIRRQDFIKILCAFSEYKAIDTSVETEDAYLAAEDAGLVSGYAAKYINWGYSIGLIGVGSNLKPKDSITRAETAAIVTRFMENFKENL